MSPRGKKPDSEGKRTPAKNPGLQRLGRVHMVGTHDTGLEGDPELTKALGDDAEALAAMDADTDVEQVMDDALADVGQVEIKAHPIGNGSTVPFPSDGEMTTDVATCDRNIPGQSRGCLHHSKRGRPFCPMGTGNPLAKKHGFAGPANLIYKNLRNGRVKTCFCTTMMSTYLHVPSIVLLPGPTWVPTRAAEFKDLPDGRKPTPGPGQARTPIVLRPHKTNVPCVPPEGLVREFQQMRRRGDFVPRERRTRR